MWRHLTLVAVAIAIVALAPPSARAEPTKTRAQSEAVVRIFAPFVIGDFDKLTVRCHRRAPHGRGFTWKCRVRWTTHSQWPRELSPFRKPAVTRTACTNSAFWNRPEWVEMEDEKTRCRVLSTASRSGF